MSYFIEADFGRAPADFCRAPADFGRAPADFGRAPADFGRAPAGFDRAPFFLQFVIFKGGNYREFFTRLFWTQFQLFFVHIPFSTTRCLCIDTRAHFVRNSGHHHMKSSYDIVKP